MKVLSEDPRLQNSKTLQGDRVHKCIFLDLHKPTSVKYRDCQGNEGVGMTSNDWRGRQSTGVKGLKTNPGVERRSRFRNAVEKACVIYRGCLTPGARDQDC